MIYFHKFRKFRQEFRNSVIAQITVIASEAKQSRSSLNKQDLINK